MTHYRAPFALVLVFVVLGVMGAAAFNSHARSLEPPVSRRDDLAQVVGEMEQRKASLEERLAELRGRLAELEDEAAEDAGMRESFREELDLVRRVAGLTELTGPGIEVVLDDADQVPANVDPSACVIHDYDVIAVVNALFAAGAEAVSVNDERVVPTTAIRCAGNTILVNSSRVGAPYVVRAIGEAERMTAHLEEDPVTGPLLGAYRQAYGLTADVEVRDDVVVPAYRGSLRAEHVVALDGGGDG